MHTVLEAISTATQLNTGSNSPVYTVLTLLDNMADMPLDFPCWCGVSDVSSQEFPQLEVTQSWIQVNFKVLVGRQLLALCLAYLFFQANTYISLPPKNVLKFSQ